CTLEVTDTAQYLLTDPNWTVAPRFHAITLARVSTILEKQSEAARARLADRSTQDRREFAGALSRLARPLGSARRDGLYGADEHDSLLAACQLVGNALGIPIKALPLEAVTSTQRASVLSEIARASHLRTRQVALEDEWWLTDSGPL